jgi:uncharacterized protein YegL
MIFFQKKCPLKNKILASSTELLKNNQQKQRRTFFTWVGSGLAALSASYLYFKFTKNNEIDPSVQDITQNIDIYEDLESDEDIELLADLEILEDLELIEQLDEES